MTAIVLQGDARQLPLPDECVDLIVTSPPYFGLRSYTDGGQHYAGQIGSEATPQAYLEALWACTREWVRVLKPGGSMFINLGDRYDARPGSGPNANPSWRRKSDVSPMRGYGSPKSLLGIPWRYAIGCTDRLGLILRAEVIWAKPNGLPESVTDRVRRAHEQVFHFTRQPRYYAAVDEIREPYSENKPWGSSARAGQKNGSAMAFLRGTSLDQQQTGLSAHVENPLGKLPGSVWPIPSAPLQVPARLGVDHFAAFPPALVRPLVLGWSPPGVCTGCGEGRRPVADVQLVGGVPFSGRDYRRLANGPNGGPERPLPGGSNRVTIISYACACPQPSAPTRPAVVLDPFGGTGTTALVATTHGRIGITVDRSMDYARLAQWRVKDPDERARAMDVPKPPKQVDGQDALFEVLG